MIVLLSCSINSSSKQLTSSTGGVSTDSVKVAINDLRNANAKLIQLSYEKDINNKLRQIIANDSILAEQARQENLLLRRSCNKVKKQRNVAIGGGCAAIVLFIISLIR
jgi:hypothetical protein